MSINSKRSASAAIIRRHIERRLPSTNIDRYSGFGASDWLPSKEYNNVWDFIQNVAINKGGHAYQVRRGIPADQVPVLPSAEPARKLDLQTEPTRHSRPTRTTFAQTPETGMLRSCSVW